jgi:hypothetical protein
MLDDPNAKQYLAEAPRPTGPLKLQIEMVPKPLWGRNLHSTYGLGKERWVKVRQQLLKAHGARCAICGTTGRLHGHEVWDYRVKKTVGTAVLLRVEMICIDCHDIRHWGRTTELFRADIIAAKRYSHLRKHFRRVNGCSQEVFDIHILESERLHTDRSTKRWTIDWGDFASAVAEARAARAAANARGRD